ncbi:4Fe-4S dicluster domain-containing protein [Siccirubricoccus deserti]|uniref:4Fe-4S dicluster domain-containing protein n=1 Tax=Siccirubricoccus deserti TaxID=2013562 RepID=A0A9X0QUP4_9PROT|nr:4Fe-4S dicluster domain-containing protein [Siccirubricoccus deserti]MBC4014206.1 4Fe-4S dicluster domain-containing protein [Siccirubricoccus deserti]
MTCLPEIAPGQKKLGLVIDLDTCVGCQACATNCKEWNASGHSAPLPDLKPYSAGAEGVWFNRVHSFEAGEGEAGRTVHFPRSCLHCETPACVTVCPTGASYKRAEDGIVLVNADTCIGCGLCAWACPYGAREMDEDEGVMKKCTLCIDRIYNETIPEAQRQPACVLTCPTKARHFGDLGDPDSAVSRLVAERGGQPLMPELGYSPVNRYLPPRKRATPPAKPVEDAPTHMDVKNPLLRWVDRVLTRMPAMESERQV